MYQRQAVDQDRNIVTVGPLTVFGGVLVDDLQTVFMDLVFTEQIDIFDGSIIQFEVFDVVFLNSGRLFGNALVGIGDLAGKKPFPLGIGKGEIIETFHLFAQVAHQIGFGSNGQKLIRLCL